MAEYYTKQDIVVRFDVYKDGEKSMPDNATVLIYDPDKVYIGKEQADILGEEVRYILAGEMVEKAGTYTFIFNVAVSGLGDYTHIVKAEVEELPVPTGEVYVNQMV